MSQKRSDVSLYAQPLSPVFGYIHKNAELVKQTMINSYLGYFEGLKNTLNKIDLERFNRINELLFYALEKGKQIFTMGNGGSGSTASHLVCDLNKGVSFNQKEKFRAICLNDNLPIILAYANDVSYSDVFCEQLKNFMNEEDLVIGFSGSGNSENVLKAVEYANENGGITIGFSGFKGGKLSKIVRFSIVAPVYDMQKSEDIHLVLCHLIMQTMNNLIRIRSYG